MPLPPVASPEIVSTSFWTAFSARASVFPKGAESISAPAGAVGRLTDGFKEQQPAIPSRK